MPYLKRTKASFKRDEKDRAILSSAKEMMEWVKLGFKEQDARNTLDIPFQRHYIDLRNCVLYISYPIKSKNPTSKIFNLCDMAGIVPGIDKIEGDPNYLFEVKYDIYLDGSELYGNFFHYVKFNGFVGMDNVTVRSTFSCFKCLFDGNVYMQNINITGRADFEQCEFRNGLILNGATSDLFHFNYSTILNRLSLASVILINKNCDGYHQNIEFTNSYVENLNLSKWKLGLSPVYFVNSEIIGMRMDNVSLDSSLVFNSCKLDGVFTIIKDDKSPDNKIDIIDFYGCDVQGQFHIENAIVNKLTFNFSKIAEFGRLRVNECKVEELITGSSSVYGQFDIVETEIGNINMDETCIHGYLSFQDNNVNEYANRQTIRLLKNEAVKVNDGVAATRFYAKEMDILLKGNNITFSEKTSLWLDKWFSGFGENWLQALLVTFGLSIVMTLLMLGCGSSKFAFNSGGEFMGVGSFVTSLLDSINVFSIPLFRDTIEEYGLNVFGQILYFLIKVIFAYGTYQFVVSFRKYGRK